MQSKKTLRRDPQFILALVVAGLFWAGIWFTNLAPVQHKPILTRLPQFILLALIYPLLEETLFRGMLQPALLGQTWARRSVLGISQANIVTSLIFSGLHFFYHPPVWAASVFLPSLLFGYFRDRYKRLYPAIILHIFYNAGFFWLFTS